MKSKDFDAQAKSHFENINGEEISNPCKITLPDTSQG